MKRSREPEDDLDSDSDPEARVELRLVNKITELDPDAVADSEEDPESQSTAMRCSLPPHKDPIAFNTYSDYESHYNKFHTNRCLECRKNFPSDHLLSIHIEECHDPLVIIKRDKGEHTYSCFVEGCERKCLTHQKRRMHMIDKHLYPKNYFFAVTKEGIDGRRSLLIESGHRRRHSSTSTPAKTREARRRESLQGSVTKKIEGTKPENKESSQDEAGNHTKTDTEMEDLTGAMSSLQFVPRSIRFGRARAGFPKK